MTQDKQQVIPHSLNKIKLLEDKDGWYSIQEWETRTTPSGHAWFFTRFLPGWKTSIETLPSGRYRLRLTALKGGQ